MNDGMAVMIECTQARDAGKEISDGCARTIAAMYHSDATGAAFSTTGAISDPSDVWRALFSEAYATDTPRGQLMADMLGTYLTNAGPRGPVAGWSALWVR